MPRSMPHGSPRRQQRRQRRRRATATLPRPHSPTVISTRDPRPTVVPWNEPGSRWKNSTISSKRSRREEEPGPSNATSNGTSSCPGTGSTRCAIRGLPSWSSPPWPETRRAFPAAGSSPGSGWSRAGCARSWPTTRPSRGGPISPSPSRNTCGPRKSLSRMICPASIWSTAGGPFCRNRRGSFPIGTTSGGFFSTRPTCRPGQSRRLQSFVARARPVAPTFPACPTNL
mmetsp:Transcript_17232/g.35401  ORF Transcript_17232/g.35401 Transcript_17232/m.35401 type:complete len:228 (+) Transcript_17232:277-960(+)